MRAGPQAGLTLIDALADEPVLCACHLLPTVCGDLLHKLGHHDEARVGFGHAAGITSNERERALLLARAGISAQD